MPKDGGESMDERRPESGAMDLINEIKNTLNMEIRPTSQGTEYLEAVIQRRDLESLLSLLKRHLGPAVKEAGKEANLPGDIEELVDHLGGLRIEQSFHYKKEGDTITYAALWPWESNPDKITLKCGVG
jgi:hypothetical protein